MSITKKQQECWGHDWLEHVEAEVERMRETAGVIPPGCTACGRKDTVRLEWMVAAEAHISPIRNEWGMDYYTNKGANLRHVKGANWRRMIDDAMSEL